MTLSLRQYQRESIDGLYDFWGKCAGNPLVVLPTACHAPGYRVMRGDGGLVKVEDVREGDTLMGPSGPRRVLQIHHGVDDMYRISPKRGEPFTVNKGHVLALRTTRDETEFITVGTYLGRSEPWKRRRSLFKVTGEETDFAIDYIGPGEYFGFTLDGDHLYVDEQGFVHHNSGKSFVMATFMREAIEFWPETRIICVTHVKELIQQNYEELLRYWPAAPAGICSAGLNRRDHSSQILFCGIQTVHKRAARIGHVDLLLVDEAHLIPRKSGTMYQRFINALRDLNPDLKVVGFTATPYRLDSGRLDQGEDRLFDGIAYEAGIRDLVAQGYLSPLVSKATEQILDVAGVHRRGGEYVPGELQAAVDRYEVTEKAVDEILAYGEARAGWLVFCSGVEHAGHVAEAIRGRGISCETIVGDTEPGKRDEIISRFKAREIRCLTNANVLTTGFNAPHVDLIAMLRPTLSTGLYVQMCGRGSRLAEAKENCIVLDFAGNVRRHGPVDAVTIREPGETGGEAPIRICDNCRSIVPAACRTCPDCGYEFPAPDEKKTLSDKASELPVMLGTPPKWLPVSRWTFHRHEKPFKPTSLRVEYLCGLVSHRQWVCFEHEGYPLQKAWDWWCEHGGNLQIPKSVDDAIGRAAELTMPSEILVQVNGRFFEVISRRFDGQRELAV